MRAGSFPACAWRATRKLAIVLAASAAAPLCASPATAGAWPYYYTEGQVIITYTGSSATQAFDADGELVDLSFSKDEISAYLEHGLNNNWTAVLRPAVQSVEAGNQGQREETVDFAGSELALRRVIAKAGGSVLSLQGGMIAPGSGESGAGDPLGSDALGGEVRILAGHGWGDRKRGGFAEAQIAGRTYDGPRPEEARLDLTVGVRPNRNWLVMGGTLSVTSVNGEDAIGARDFTGHRVQASVVRRINKRLAVQAGGRRTVEGTNVVQENAGFVGLWVRY